MPRPQREPTTENGRPLKEIDWEWVDKQLMAGCLGTEIAAGLKMHPNTFYERTVREKGLSFTEYSTLKSADGERLLRGKQFETALKGNVTMQIWLGKQRLGQRDQDNTKQIEEIKADLAAFAQSMNQGRAERSATPQASHNEKRADSDFQPASPRRFE